MRSLSLLSVCVVSLAVLAAGSGRAATIERVSVDSAGTAGEDDSFYPALSANGRFVAFQSGVATLVPGDDNDADDVFVADRKTRAIERVSVGSGGTQAHGGDSENPAISANGRYVAFESAATDLVPDDGNGKIDVFVHDRRLGVTERVSLAPPPLEADGDSRFAGISANGRYVAFHSAATNLVPEDGNQQADVFAHDRRTGVTRRVSVDAAGTETGGGGALPVVSANGRAVAFESPAAQLVPEDANALLDVFVHDRRHR